jgi:cytosolic phospholipase A2
MISKGALLIVLLSLGCSVYADTLEVVNTTDLEIGVAPYYVKGFPFKKDALRVGKVELIPAGVSRRLERPARKFGFDRQLVFSFNPGDLLPYLTEDQLHIRGNTNIGMLQGSTVYIALTRGHLTGYNYAEWTLMRPLIQQIQKGIAALDEATLGALRRRFSGHGYGTQTAFVRLGTGIGQEERSYLVTRGAQAKYALERFLGMHLQDNEVPRIAICGSGGGYRAMLNTLGALLGIQNIGLLDGITYLAGVSGSTWAIAPWIQLGISLDTLKNRLINQLSKPLYSVPLDIQSLSSYLLIKLSFGQSLSLVDIYGALLASHLLGTSDPMKYSFADQAHYVKQGTFPLPIYTAAVTKLPYEWIEFTPYEVGSDYLGGYVPAWAFGRRFLQGKSIDFAPPLSLGFLMGVWGSAFAANVTEILNIVKNRIQPAFLRSFITAGTQETIIGRQRLFPATVFNYTYGLNVSPRRQQETFTLVDAGIDFNLPLPPLLAKERAIDLIIILDASAEEGSVSGKQLKKAEEYLKRYGIKFPTIPYQGIESRICSVFRDPADSSIPTVIYMPQIKNPGYSRTFDPASCLPTFCSSFNFTYKPAEVELLVGLARYNIESCRYIIAHTLREIVEAKRRRLIAPAYQNTRQDTFFR